MAITVFAVNYLQLCALLFALDHFPANNPRRWEAIASYIEMLTQKDEDVTGLELFDMYLTQTTATKRSKRVFTGSPQECRDLTNIIHTSYPHIISTVKQLYQPLLSNPDRKSPLKPLVLTPPLSACCGSTFTLRNRPAFPIVYTNSGTYIAASYHGNCTACKKVYYPSHYENPQENISVFYDVSTMKYLQISSQTAFEIAFLERVNNELSICSTTFEAVAETYTMNHFSDDKKRLEHLEAFSRAQSSTSPWAMNAQRLEEGWFILKLCQFYQCRGNFSKNFHTTLVNGRKDLEELCKQAHQIFSTEPPTWIQHSCRVPGCSKGYATLDGNEKITRTMCSAPSSKVQIPTSGISVMSCCPNTPALGGNKKAGSKYCSDHSFLDSKPGSQATVTGNPTNLSRDPANERFGTFSAQDIHNDTDLQNSDTNDGCKKPSNITKFYDRTAGIIALLRSCGIVINWTEMYTCESLTQVYLFLIFTFGRGSDIKRLRYLGYDRGCSLHPFLVNLSIKNIMFAKYFLEHVRFLVDRFHVSKHTEKCCMPLHGNPLCKYHPDLEEFKDIDDVNTECAEQAFRWLNKLKYSVRQMSRYRFNFFLHELINQPDL